MSDNQSNNDKKGQDHRLSLAEMPVHTGCAFPPMASVPPLSPVGDGQDGEAAGVTKNG